MKIGVLNELLNDISCDISVRQEICGNPVEYQPVFIK